MFRSHHPKLRGDNVTTGSVSIGRTLRALRLYENHMQLRSICSSTNERLRPSLTKFRKSCDPVVRLW